jgi:hypothetical protein
MAMLATLVLIGLSSAAVFGAFVAGRLLAGWAFRVGAQDRLPPFGEARPAGFERALPGARLAITLGGPLAIYAFAASLCVAAFALGARVGAGLGVSFGPDPGPVHLGAAIRQGAAFPARLLISVVESTVKRESGEAAGPMAFVVGTARLPGYGDRLLMMGSAAAAAMIVFGLSSLALWPPRRRGRADPGPRERSVEVGVTEQTPRPGVRLAARAMDWMLIWIAVGLLLPAALVLAPLIWCPIEALLLSRWGFTPGKWLLRISVRDDDGRPPLFRDALRRAAAVWVYGAGAYTPFGIATAVMAYAGLKRKGTTYWDTLGRYQVHHRPVGAAPAVMAAMILGVAVAIVRGARLW